MCALLYNATLLLLSLFCSLFIFSLFLFATIFFALLLLFLHSSPLPPLSFSLSQSKISSISSSFIFYSLGPSWLLSLPLSLALILPAHSLLSLISSLIFSQSSLFFSFSLYCFLWIVPSLSSFNLDCTLYIVPSHPRTHSITHLLTHSLTNTHTHVCRSS